VEPVACPKRAWNKSPLTLKSVDLLEQLYFQAHYFQKSSNESANGIEWATFSAGASLLNPQFFELSVASRL
jgi:hypothetical protein